MYQSDDAAALRRQGYRLTPQRMVVLEVIKSSRAHLTAEQIHAAVLERQPCINIATIYRTVQWLEHVGLVAPISLGSEPIHYEYISGAAHHHLVCQVCGGQREIDDDTFACVRQGLLARYGFEIQLRHLALPGVCAHCRDHQGNGGG